LPQMTKPVVSHAVHKKKGCTWKSLWLLRPYFADSYVFRAFIVWSHSKCGLCLQIFEFNTYLSLNLLCICNHRWLLGFPHFVFTRKKWITKDKKNYSTSEPCISHLKNTVNLSYEQTHNEGLRYWHTNSYMDKVLQSRIYITCYLQF
jgi:hypothetical protein